MTNPTPMPSMLANRYRVLRVLGDGGFGTTYLAEDSQMPSQRKCVVKQLKPVEENPQIYQLVKERFQREAAILETLGDGFEQIPHLYAYFSEGDQFYLVEEWVEGETLTQKVKREGLLPETTVRTILSQTLPVLGYIHQKQMVHRDIKPDNIIMRQVDQVPVLIDFGAVKETMSTVVNSQGDSSRSIVVGTPGFMPSEQMAGRPLFSSDLYSLGLTAIYLLTGRIPQDLETDPGTGNLRWQQFVSHITPGFATFIDRAIQMNPRDRFQSADQMLMALQAFDAPTVSAHPGGFDPTQVNAPLPTPGYYPAPSYPPADPPPSNPPGYQTPVQQPSYPVPPPPQPGYQTPGYQQPQYVAPQYLQTPQNSVPPSTQPTVQIPGYGSAPSPVVNSVQPQSAGGDWKKAGIIGGLIGLSILGGAMMLRAQIGDFISNFSGNTTEEVKPSPQNTSAPSNPVESSGGEETASTGSSSPAPPPSQPVPEENWDTDAKIIGSPGKKNIRSGPGTNFGVKHVAYPGDRVQVLDEDYDSGGFLWYLIYFPQSNVEGWIAGQLLKIDGLPAYVPPKNPPKTPEKPPEKTPEKPVDEANATIVGSPGAKNIRSGPGTNFAERHIAYPGDRVIVTGSDTDSGGYLWYQVYFPKSGAEGWIAAQLLQID